MIFYSIFFCTLFFKFCKKKSMSVAHNEHIQCKWYSVKPKSCAKTESKADMKYTCFSFFKSQTQMFLDHRLLTLYCTACT